MNKQNHRLEAALLFSSVIITIFGQLYVHTPEGLFGSANEISQPGAYFAIASLTLSLVAIILRWFRPAFARLLSQGLVLIFAISFVPAIGQDPVHSGVVIAWQLYVLYRYISAPQATLAPKPYLGMQRLQDCMAAHRNSALIALLLTIAIDGFRVTVHPLGLALCLLAHLNALVFLVPILPSIQKNSVRLYWLTIVLGLTAIGLSFEPRTALMIASLFQIVALYAGGRLSPVFHTAIDYFLRQPALFVTASYLAIILIGALALTFPSSTTSDVLSPIDALFTAVSAVCVTGLIVLDTPHDFTMFGQGIILMLIQLGGLGIMTLSTVGARLIVGSLGLLAETTFGSLLELKGPQSVYRLIKVILIATLVIESIGTLVLTLIYYSDGLPFGKAIWYGLFHTISAFCNAGFALDSLSLEPQANNFALLFLIMALIFLGGIGFPTMMMLYDYWKNPAKVRLPVQVKIVLLSTLVITLGTWVGFCVLEWNQSLAHLSPTAKLVNGLFQTITLRTAGFNSIPLQGIGSATLALMMLNMIIGGAPGGTAGGIKLTTITLLFASIPSFGHGGGSVTMGNRQITPATMFRSIAILVVYIVLLGFLHFSLLLSESQKFEVLAFEAVSAIGTVGLSLGITPSLTLIGKFLVMFGMFAGRIGPLTLTLTIARRPQTRYKLANEQVMVG